jgi:hypothetical protein
MINKSQRRASAIERLRALPPVFRGSDLSLRFGWSTHEAGEYLRRWKQRDLVKPTGPRAGVYFNLISETSAPETHLEEAIATLFPSAVVVGASVLHGAGWITQIPRQLDVAVLRRRTFPAVKGVVLHPRRMIWYRLVHSRLERTEGQGVPRFDPAFALADALKYRDGWVPQPDDVEFPEAEDAQQFLRACKTLRVALDPEWLNTIRLASPDSGRIKE